MQGLSNISHTGIFSTQIFPQESFPHERLPHQNVFVSRKHSDFFTRMLSCGDNVKFEVQQHEVGRKAEQTVIVAEQVLARASFLGWIFSIGLIFIWNYEVWDFQFGIYLCILSFFHFSEYFIMSVTNPSTLSLDSFLLNHSKSYGIAAAGSWIEYGLEFYFFPDLKYLTFATTAGCFLCIGGEILRKLAMITAKENFTHVIRTTRVEGHTLVTHGVFKICRHPSYAGWFWWSIGTQVLLFNPICLIGYLLAGWNFFCHRITYEEAKLYSFFGQDYNRYKQRVPWSGIPLVTGFKTCE